MLNDIWVEKFRPGTMDEIVLDSATLEYFREKIKDGKIPHVLFVSAPGSGKTSLAKILVKELGCSYRYINASDERGIDTIREKVIGFAQTKSFDGGIKIIILDEMDGLTPDAQRALRNTMEEFSENAGFILTANYKNRIIEAIRSRAQIFEIVPPFDGCVKRVVEIIKTEGIKVSTEQKERLMSLIKLMYPDLRSIIKCVQQYTINGSLKIPEKLSQVVFPSKVYNLISENKSANEIRKYVIENELEFNSDYLLLLKGLFEHIFDQDIPEDKKRNSMLTVGRYMESHQQVMDFEINAFCCIIQLLQIIN